MGCQSSDPGSVAECVTFKFGQYTVCCMYAVSHLLPGGQKHAWTVTHCSLIGNMFKRKRNTSLRYCPDSFHSYIRCAWWISKSQIHTSVFRDQIHFFKQQHYKACIIWTTVMPGNIILSYVKEEAGVFILRSYWKCINMCFEDLKHSVGEG